MIDCSIGLTDTLTAEIQGSENFGKSWFFRMMDIPDLYFQLHSIQIRVRSDGTCICQAKYSYSGTAIIHVNPNRITKILKILTNYNNRNNYDMNVLPNLLNLEEILIKEMNHSLDSFNEELLFIDELKELFDHDHDQLLLNEFVNDQKQQDDNHRKEMIFSFNEEKEYLFSLFTDVMRPARSSPRIPDVSETLPLRFPYEFIGDATFHVNDELKIFRLDLHSALTTK